MARASSSISLLLRQNPCARQNPTTHFRYLKTETKDCDFTQVAQQISRIVRTKPRWEKTLLTEYPSLNFTDPGLVREILKQQNDVLFSLRFFVWLSSHDGFWPDPISCGQLFNGLVEAKACGAAKRFLECTGFSPEPGSLESYAWCLFEVGWVDEAVDVFDRLKKEDGVCSSIRTWNAALSGCLKAGRTDIVWKLYGQMIDIGVAADVDSQTVGYLIQAFCDDNEVMKGYGLLRQVLENGLVPGKAAFDKLISGLCKQNEFSKVSELLHTMIAANCVPDIATYQEIINWLCKNGKVGEGFRIFNDLKDRGYSPDIVTYTTMIHGFCMMGSLQEARKLWDEMIDMGYRPNEYTYTTMIHGFCKSGHFELARSLHKEMCDKGYKETTVSYNAMMTGLCLHGRTDEAYRLFEEMPRKDIVRDVITYNCLIKGFCKEGRIADSMNLFRELLTQGLQPSAYSYGSLIETLCQVGRVEEAKSLWNDMKNIGLEPISSTHDYIIIGLCDQGDLTEGMDWFMSMLTNKLKPEQRTFLRLLSCLLQRDRLDDCLVVLKSMFKVGYTLEKGTCYSLVIKLCSKNTHFGETCLGDVLEGSDISTCV